MFLWLLVVVIVVVIAVVVSVVDSVVVLARANSLEGIEVWFSPLCFESRDKARQLRQWH